MKYLKILFLIICCFLNVTICYAAASISVNFNNPNSGDRDGSYSTPTDTDGDGMINESYPSGDYTCNYEYEFRQTTNVDIHGYDVMNRSIINGQVTPNRATKAGTSIGIGIVESKTANWRYDFSVTKKTSTCTRPTYNYGCYFSYSPHYKEGVYEAGGTPTDALSCRKLSESRVGCLNWDEDFTTVDSGTEYENCKAKAIASSQGAASRFVSTPSYTDIKLLNPNDVNATEQFSITSKGCTNSCETASCSCEHIYTPKSVCIDKVTSNVRYATADNCEPDEFQIKNDVIDSGSQSIEHFHYFVPLNVTSGWFSLVLSESPDVQDAEWCKAAIDANPTNYADFFVGAPLIEGGDKIPLPPNNPTMAKSDVENGCYIKTEIRIPVSEGLYDVNYEKIDGYNLFVRNANENNPFPNPIENDDSLWFDWYSNNYSGGKYSYNKVAPNIKNSFEEESKTYVVEKINAAMIRGINKNIGSYFKSKLDVTGKSSFIGNDISFAKTSNNYSKVGCGPLNSSMKITVDGVEKDNPLYQVGCE